MTGQSADGRCVPLLDVRGLCVTYRSRGRTTQAVSGVDLTIAAGETVAVVGESGSGKSTTAHALLGLLPAGGRITAGTVRFDGEELTALDDRRLRKVRGRDIALVPQDPAVSLNPVQRVGDQVAEVLLIHGLAGRKEAAAAATDILELAGMPEPALRARNFPHQLSGGMRQRALIAIALAGRPRLIVADEPTSALDTTVQQRILDHLQKLSRESGTAVLLISHDLAVAAARADRIIVMRGGEVVEAGPAEQVTAEPRHEYTRLLLDAVPGAPNQRRTVARDREAATEGPRPLLVAEDLVMDYPLPRTGGSGGRTLRALDGVGFTVPVGRTVALVGESGSGKSTAARLALRLLRPSAGRIEFDGRDITAAPERELRALRRGAQLIHQNPYAALDPRLSVERIVEEPLRVFRTEGRTARLARVRALLDRVALPAHLHERRPATLSGGQRQRVAIARALALEPRLVVCDEPLSALDVSVQARILALLEELQAELGIAYLFITHDLAVVRQIADEVLVLKDGRIVESGKTERLFTSPQHEHTKALLHAAPQPAVSRPKRPKRPKERL
ncbi:dipeptide ABC transporter ATP-binding protein [Streptomyces sp. NPDC087901]|uniref:dipeptide ABC transporter ATP-binding protein n=1 Tax=Streptomyces sp. NPDC087901 TaxID=3365818 RepID=UPI0037F8F0A2